MRNSRKFLTFLKFIRFGNSLISLVTVFVYSILTFGVVQHIDTLIYISFIIILSLSAGNIINDFFDYQIDCINRPDRPLPSKYYSLNFAKMMYGLFVFSAILFSLKLNTLAFLIVVFNNVILFFYSKIFKQKLLIGNIVVSYLTASVLIFCGFVFTNFDHILLAVLFAFFSNFIRELVKDLEDYEGDKLLNLQTFAVRKSLKTNKVFICILVVLLIGSSFLPFILNTVSNNYWYFIILGIVLPFSYILKLVIQANEKAHFSRISNLIKLFMLLGLFVLIVIRNDITIPIGF